MPHLSCAALARAGARLCAAFLLVTTCAHAEPLAAALARNAALPRAPLLAPDAFDQPERLRDVRLSPDGSHLAWIEDEGNKAELHVMPLGGGAPRPLIAVDPKDRVHWSRDGAVLFVAQEGSLSAVGMRDGAGGRVAMFAKDGSQRFAGIDRGMPRHAIVQETDVARRTTRLVRIGADGARTILFDGPGVVAAFLAGPDGAPAVLRSVDAGFNQLVLRREGASWVEAARCKPLRTCALVALSQDGKRLLLRTRHADDREALIEVTLAGGARRLLHTDPDALSDLVGVTLSPHSGQPMLATYQLPRLRLYGLDDEGRRIAASIARQFPQGGALVESCAPTACLVVERGARLSHARFWILGLQRQAFRPVLDEVRARAAPLPPAQLAEHLAISYPASDGATVHGYLTLPAGLPARALPLLTVVHGGPWSHVDGGYSALAQLLANRGYAVFQPNFRGSTGYGERYTKAPGAGYGNGRAQADIIDGVRWLLAQGVGDPQRLGIAGASFGGYATLLALTHNPGMFRFGMAMQPTPDFARTLRVSAAEPARPGEPPLRQVLREAGIDPDNAAQMAPIAADAPRRQAARLTAPLMVLAGGRDEKIEIEAVVDYVAHLQGLGKQVGLLIDPDAGHNLRDPVAKKAQVHLLLTMLHRYLGGPPAPAPDDALARYLARTMRTHGALGK
ncbi:S9 family peptidase [Massilia yuzhufengensis]|uniref:Dipeptidyl aminopeptidase/acylaminoacyl peptidase n=1 Tax=Massilia yuzhufengensis TaxID=1164594 RepID=A0A1I1I786_9BURK|nr:prolyl oligopeptidase family serine peptidase [Massilia yuzhufengensis]SFC32006.1 Dipeptidyl aminopeptidase/acylaminoacyl peptidase [Massilia yuzhufengensis]